MRNPMEQRTNAGRQNRRGVPSLRLAAHHLNVPLDSSRRDQQRQPAATLNIHGSPTPTRQVRVTPC
jgi:hypothetical protein